LTRSARGASVCLIITDLFKNRCPKLRYDSVCLLQPLSALAQHHIGITHIADRLKRQTMRIRASR
jgi:hypothetical protein